MTFLINEEKKKWVVKIDIEDQRVCTYDSRVDLCLAPARTDFCFRRVTANVLLPSN